MNSKVFYNYCLAQLGAVEDYPFGPDVIVFKIGAKMFALMSRRNNQDNLSLKCDPHYSEILRKQYSSIIPGYHLNKRCWNTLILDGSIPEKEIKALIEHSYELVFKSLPRMMRAKYQDDF